MIVPMRKTYVVARRADQDRLLESLQDLGVVHVMAIDPARAVADDKTLAAIGQYDRAMQMLLATGLAEPAGAAPDLSAADAVAETLEIERDSATGQSRLIALHRDLEELALWGDTTLEALDQISQAGLDLEVLAAPAADVAAIQAELVEEITVLPDDRTLLGVVGRDKDVDLPEAADILEVPKQDRPAIRARAAEIDAELKRGVARLGELAHCIGAIRTERAELAQRANVTVVRRSGMDDEGLFALQGWAPARRAETLVDDLAAVGIDAGVEHYEPDEEDDPPTLLEYPKWVRPIEALSKILGTLPGYAEIDLSAFLMLALPLFAAMLLGDAGYGLLFTLVGVLCYKKISSGAGRPAAQLLLVFALTTLTWGLLTGNCFGITPTALKDAGGVWASLGGAQESVAVLWSADTDTARNIIIKLSFIFGGIHLVTAHLLQALKLAPDQRFIGQLGWASFLAGMLGVVWMLFFPDEMWMSSTVLAALLGAGAVGFLLFSCPSKNPVKRLGLGLANSILPMIGSFSDTMSYIRLMAVGMASFYIAKAFNDLAWSIGSSNALLIPASVLIVLFAHSLNIGLGLIAVFAHGVRLNLLEFSSNAGVQWTGYAYRPFAKAANEGVG